MIDWACVFCAAELGGLFSGGAADRGLVPPVPNEKFRALEMRKPAASYTARSWHVPPGRGALSTEVATSAVWPPRTQDPYSGADSAWEPA
jgi:hypothetical protein